MHDNHPPENGLRADQFDVFIRDNALCCPALIGRHVAEIADVANGALGAAMGSIVWIIMGACEEGSVSPGVGHVPAEIHPLVLSPKALRDD